MKNVPNELQLQIDNFVRTQSERCESRIHDKASVTINKRNFEWIKYFAIKHFESRIERATDIISNEVEESQKLAREYIGEKCHVFFATCVDGRNMPSVMFSKPPHVGGVLRTPAGIVSGFMHGQGSETVYIDKESFVIQRILTLLREKTGGTIFYSLDSHVGCAARNQIHETEGGNQIDAGLRSDIVNKIMTAKGIIDLRNELVAKEKSIAEIIPTFFTYDPRSGCVISGLEMHVNRPEITKDGYTDENIANLAKGGLILRSSDLLLDKKIIEKLNIEIEPKSANFRSSYPSSLLNNWKAITNLFENGNGLVYKIIFEKLQKAYTDSGWEVTGDSGQDDLSISFRVLEHKAKFILRNLVTRYSIAGVDEEWPYDNHSEELIVITDGGYAPFSSQDAFAVFSKDTNSLVVNTKLTIDLIRMFRRTGKIQNTVIDVPLDKHDFASAPIFISSKAILKDLSQNSFVDLANLDLDSAFSNINWDDPDILVWRKSNISKLILSIVESKKVKLEMSGTLRFVDAVYELFDRMRIMMKDKQFRQMILNGNIVIFNTIVDRNRMPRIVINMAI